MDKIERQGLYIVLNGNFNPAIFNPDWLFRHSLFDPNLSEAQIEVITSSYAKFRISDFVFQITEEKFVLQCLNEPFVKSGDLVASIFAEILPETPLSQLGINLAVHFKVGDWRRQRALGRLLAPIDVWQDWGMSLESDSIERVGGLASLSMEEKTFGTNWHGHTRVTVEPSRKLAPGTGVFVQVNEQYEGNEGSKVNLALFCAEKITESVAHSRQIIIALIEKAWEAII